MMMFDYVSSSSLCMYESRTNRLFIVTPSLEPLPQLHKKVERRGKSFRSDYLARPLSGTVCACRMLWTFLISFTYMKCVY